MITARFPRIVYASGSGLGPQGPDANQGGYDLSAYWSRAGTAYCVTPRNAERPADMPAPGFGDVPSGTILAGGIAAALFRRERTGAGSVIDLSLLNAGMWAMSGELTATEAIGADRFYQGDGRVAGNPLVALYRTRDGRFIQLVMTDGDRHFADLCRAARSEPGSRSATGASGSGRTAAIRRTSWRCALSSICMSTA